MVHRLEYYFDKLWPICRSITGNGVRETLRIISEIIPLNIYEVPSGTKVFDWEVPKEWNITDAYVLSPDGEKVIDFKLNNLHIVNYSIPVDIEISFEELNNHLYYIEDYPDAIPYITSYYNENWGFCLSYNQYKILPKVGKYRVVINSSLKNGSMTYGDYVLQGESEKEVLLSTYTCHPSMANNELSGILVLSFLYEKLKSIPNRKLTYRFIFAPETIGAINYLNKHGLHLKRNLKAGFIITCVGDSGKFNFKNSRDKNNSINKLIRHVFKNEGVKYNNLPFNVLGSDERQYSSPGFNLPVVSITRSIYHSYREYHTSKDCKDFISFTSILETIEVYLKVFKALELNNFYYNQNPFCEPQLGKRGMYPKIGAARKHPKSILRTMLALNFSDGNHDLVDIAEIGDDSIFDYEEIINQLIEKKLLDLKKNIEWN